MASRLHHVTHLSSPPRSRGRSPGEYSPDHLESRPDIAQLPLDESPPRARLRRPVTLALSQDISIDSSHNRPYPASSSSKLSQPPMFSGPPPPISASMMTIIAASSKWENSTHGASTRGIPDILVDRRQQVSVSHPSASAWRGLRRKERGLEQEIQQLLDLQATALVEGSPGRLGTRSLGDNDGRSEDGCTTPMDTFLSIASTSSRMPKSLYIPARSTPEGDVIPVRQPTNPRRMGLHALRNGLRESLAALADLRREEDAHANAALSERRTALSRLDSLGTRRTGILEALKLLENGDEEPLGQELRKLGSEHETIDDEIQQLEEKLVGMRNRRRWLKGRIDDVKSKREAGLSGYRGALKDVDAEVSALLRRPLVQPLDQEMLSRGKDSDEGAGSAGGLEFMRLIPQRRNVGMAKAWWKAEIEILEQQRAHIGEEQQALEQGSIIWQEVMALVTRFESRLRETMKAETSSSTASLVSDGKKASSREVLIRSQLPLMGEVVTELAQRMRVAESKHWNLLICAIGAEWEAFKEAHDVLKGIVDGADGGVVGQASPVAEVPQDDVPTNHGEADQDIHAESDNEVPTDLLVSRLNDLERGTVGSRLDHAAARERRDSVNNVPPEFLAEHDHGKDL